MTNRSFDKWSDIHKEAHDIMSYPDVVSVEIREAQGSVTSLATPVIEEPLKGRKGKKA